MKNASSCSSSWEFPSWMYVCGVSAHYTKQYNFKAPCEAEAQCAELVKTGKVYAVGTEDMDALTFGSTVLLRHLTFSEARKMPIKVLFNNL